MRIDRMFLDGFGHFNQRDISANGSLTVISGANEAGKSTLLSFVRTILFGFPTPSRINEAYPPTAGGRHGGRLTITTDAGDQYTIERYPGTHGGTVNVTGPNGALLDGTILPILVGNASEQLFKSVFAFSLKELQDTGTLKGDEVSGRIYSAGMGVADLPAVQRNIDRAKTAIFAPRGRVHEVATTLREIGAIESQLDGLANQASEYGQLVSREAEIERELSSISTQRSEHSSRLMELNNLSRAWEEWNPIFSRETVLNDLPNFNGFPEGAVGRLESLDRRIDEIRPEVKDAEDSLARAQEASNAEIPDESMLEDSSAIDSILRGRDRFDASVHDIPERRSDLVRLEDSLNKTLRDLGTGWTETRLEEFDTSYALRDEVEQWGARLSESEQNARECTGELERFQQAGREAVRFQQEAQTKMEDTSEPVLTPEQLTEHQRALRASRSRLDDLLRARQQRQTLEAQLNFSEGPQPADQSSMARFPIVPIALGIGGLVAIAVGFVLDGQEVALIAGVGMLVLAGVTFMQTRSGPSGGAGANVSGLQSQVREATAAESEAENALQEAARILQLPGSVIDSGALDDAEANLEAVRDAIRIRDEAVQGLADAENRSKQQNQRVSDAQDALDHSKSEQTSIQSNWREWLSGKELAVTLTPATVMELRNSAETARVQLAEVVAMRDRINAIQVDIQEHCDLVEPVASRHGIFPGSDDPRQVATVAEDLIARLSAATEANTVRENAKKATEDALRTVNRVKNSLKTLEEDRQKLIELGGAQDSEDLRRRAVQHAERRDLERQNSEGRERLLRLFPGQALADVTVSIEETSPDILEQDQFSVRATVEEIDNRRDQLTEERGQVRTQLGQLASAEEASELRAQKEALQERLRRHALEWSKYTLASVILQRTRQKYEQERQPGVINHAEKFFTTITGGRYRRLFVPMDSPSEVAVEAESGARLNPSQLSRGTQEQLYLALRFGLIREFGEQAERLPVVVDEVLVNFDPTRQRRAAEAFVSLSETNQVLVFTCHPQTVDLFTDIAPHTQVIDLSEMTA